MKCIICGNSSFFKIPFIHEVSRYTEKTYPLFECKRCGLVRPNPLPYKDIEKSSIYAAHENIKFFDSKSKRITRKTEEYKYYFKHFQPYLNLIKKYYLSGKALDVGCGAGHLLKLLSEEKFDVEGLEISPELVNALKSDGFEAFCCEMGDKTIKCNTYDLVTLNQVLEHIDDPKKFAHNLNRILKKGGHLILAVPYLYGLVPQILRTKWYGLGYGQHLNFFSKKSLEILLEKEGFKILEFKKLIVDYAHPKFPKILNTFAGILSQIIVSLGMGDNLFLIAKKTK